MGMQTYGYSELQLDMDKAKKAAPLEYITMTEAIKEEDLSPSEVWSGDHSDKVKKAIKNFTDKILYELEVEIFLVYISNEAEGIDEDYIGQIIWCIFPEYQPQILNAMKEHISWSEYS